MLEAAAYYIHTAEAQLVVFTRRIGGVRTLCEELQCPATSAPVEQA